MFSFLKILTFFLSSIINYSQELPSRFRKDIIHSLDKKESGYVHTKDFISFLDIIGVIKHFSNDELKDLIIYESESDHDVQHKDIISTLKLEELFGNANGVQSHCELWNVQTAKTVEIVYEEKIVI